MLDFKEILGFKFVKAGAFYLAKEPWTGGGKKTGIWESYVSLRLYDGQYRKADETVYLVYSELDLKYVGEFSYNLEDRWLKENEDYVKHEKFKNIENEINNGHEVTIWLAVSPYDDIDEINQLNISKSIEHEILRKYSPEWNSRNKTGRWEDWRKDNCIKVADIINSA